MTAVAEQHDAQLKAVAQQLAELRPQAEDYVSDTRRLGFAVDTESNEEGLPLPVILTVDDVEGEYRLTDHAQQQVASRLQVPWKFWERIRDNHADILQDTVTKLFNREPEERLVRTLRGDTARAFLSNRYRILDNYDLMQESILPALQEHGPDEMYVLQARVTEMRLYLKILFPGIEYPNPRGGDKPLHGGLILGNSEVGAGRLFVDPFMYDSFCTNGLVYGRQDFPEFGLSKVHVGRQIEADDDGRRLFSDETLRKDDEAFFAAAKDVISNALNGIVFKAIFDQIEEAAGLKVEGDHVKAVERVVRKYDLRESEGKAMMEHLIEGGNLSAWGYVSALTRTARDVGNYDRQVELERVGVQLLKETPAGWKSLAAAA